MNLLQTMQGYCWLYGAKDLLISYLVPLQFFSYHSVFVFILFCFLTIQIYCLPYRTFIYLFDKTRIYYYFFLPYKLCMRLLNMQSFSFTFLLFNFFWSLSPVESFSKLDVVHSDHIIRELHHIHISKTYLFFLVLFLKRQGTNLNVHLTPS